MHRFGIGHRGHRVGAAANQQGGGLDAGDIGAQVFHGQGLAAAGIAFGGNAGNPSLGGLHHLGLAGDEAFSEPAAGR